MCVPLGLFVLVLTVLVTETQGKTCFSCSALTDIKDCNVTKECQQNETCFIREYVSGPHDIRYDLDCMPNWFCEKVKTFHLYYPTKRKSEIVIWNQCCNGNNCNKNYSNIGVQQERGSWCYTCDKVFMPGFCGVVQKCPASEDCYTASHIGLNGGVQYRSGCLPKIECPKSVRKRSLEVDDICTECCHGDLCNSQLCGGKVIKKAGTKLCLKCSNVGKFEECDEVDLCGQDQQCFMKKTKHLNQEYYTLGCADNSACSRTNDVCCDTDMCNAVNTEGNNTSVLTSVTPSATVSSHSTSGSTSVTPAAYSGAASTSSAKPTRPTALSTSTHTTTTPAATTTVSTVSPIAVDTSAATTATKSPTTPVSTCPPTAITTTTKTTTKSTISTATTTTTTTPTKPPPTSQSTSIPTTTMVTTTMTTTTTIPGIPPDITQANQSVSVYLHDNITLSCDISGNPMPTVTWEYDTQHVFNAKAKGSRLFLTYVTKENEGDYVCFAENGFGTKEGTIQLQVKVPVEVKLETSVVVLDPADMRGVARLKCTVTGDPQPNVTWNKYGSDEPIKTDTNHFVYPDGDLLITGIDPTNFNLHAGIYVCKGDNGVDTAVAYQVAAAKIPYLLDEVNRFQSISVEPGEAFYVRCASGVTEPDGLPINKGFTPKDKICVSARQVGALGKEAGWITYFIKSDGNPEIIDQSKGNIIFT